MDGAPAASQRSNNFDVLRLVAAVAVLVSHSFALSGHAQPLVGGEHLGTVGLLVFFGISGYLISSSWGAEPHVVHFVTKRALRIFPALLVVLLVSALVIGPLASTLEVPAYFARSQPLMYVLRNLAMWPSPAYNLPGVFHHNPFPNAVNGSLWTLRLEVRAYAVVAVLGVLGVLRARWVAVAAFSVIAIVTNRLPGTGVVVGDTVLLRTFLAGAAIYTLGSLLPWRWDLALLGILVWLLAASTHAGPYVATAVIPYAAVVAAHKTPSKWRRITRHGDFSYGLYLWAWPVQQLTALIAPGVSSVAMIGVSLPVAYAMGAASWLLLERRALRLKPRSTSALLEVVAERTDVATP